MFGKLQDPLRQLQGEGLEYEGSESGINTAAALVPHNFLGEVLRSATFHSSHYQRARCTENQEYH